MVCKIWQHDNVCVLSLYFCLGSRAFGCVVTCFRMLGNMFSVVQCLTKGLRKHMKTWWNVRKLWTLTFQTHLSTRQGFPSLFPT